MYMANSNEKMRGISFPEVKDNDHRLAQNDE